MKEFIFTVDVERLCFETHSFDNKVVKRIEDIAIPKLLTIFSKNNIKATFFYTAEYVKLSKGSIIEVKKNGHEIGLHGWDHTHYYDKMQLKEQLYYLEKSKDFIETKSNSKICSFRAPFLRINSNTIETLELLDFKIDSSIASKRCDFIFTSSAEYKLNWLFAPSCCYFPSYQSPFKKGDSKILEIPISSLIWSLTGTHLRICNLITRQLTEYFINQSNNNPIVFLIHPNELLSYKKKKTIRKGNIFQDNIRHWIKMKDLGDPTCEKLNSLIQMIKSRVQFITLNDFYEKLYNQ
jgi:peptidoglycan-N-acetylglucosamine deacetylase